MDETRLKPRACSKQDTNAICSAIGVKYFIHLPLRSYFMSNAPVNQMNKILQYEYRCTAASDSGHMHLLRSKSLQRIVSLSLFLSLTFSHSLSLCHCLRLPFSLSLSLSLSLFPSSFPSLPLSLCLYLVHAIVQYVLYIPDKPPTDAYSTPTIIPNYVNIHVDRMPLTPGVMTLIVATPTLSHPRTSADALSQ